MQLKDMFFNSNNILLNQLRNQTLAKQRIRSITTNRYQYFKYKVGTNGGQNANSIWDSFRDKFNEKISVFVHLFRQQSNVYMSLRLRRMAQICGLYNRIYSESSVNKLMSQMLARLRVRALNTIRNRLNSNKNKASAKVLMSAVCGLFCWDNQRITDRDLNQSIQDFETIQRVGLNGNNQSNDYNVSKSTSFSVSAETHNKKKVNEEIKSDNEWEEVIMREDFKIWRKPIPDTSLYEYKIFGTYNDIPALTFFRVQLDTEFRKVWDKLVIKLDVIEREPKVADKDDNKCQDSGNEVLHWIMRYPYPMNSREYVYLRRSRIDVHQNLMVLISKAVEHPHLPESPQHVRVMHYSSQMVIKPHTTFDECGFDYMLTYFDDPRAAFPVPAYNWMASYGVTDFLEKLHSAAVQLYSSMNSPNQKSNKCLNKCYDSSQQNQNTKHSPDFVYA